MPVLAQYIVRSDGEEIELSNGIIIEIQTASFRSVRGYTIIAALCDELAFWRDDASANPDEEIINALRACDGDDPRRDFAVREFAVRTPRCVVEGLSPLLGQPGRVLVWRADTRTMNPTVPEEVIAEAYENDPASAAAEFGAEFLTDIETFVAREVVEALVVPDRYELPPLADQFYFGFVDPSGGSNDSMTLAIGHFEGVGHERCVLDLLREIRPPFSPESVVAEFAGTLRDYRIVTVTGDRYGGQWPTERFREHGIQYDVAEKPKSGLYREFLPMLNSDRVELLDHPRLLRISVPSSAAPRGAGATASIIHRATTMRLPTWWRGYRRVAPLPEVVITDVLAAARWRPIRRHW